jgi:hypothetical protein
MPDTNIVPFPTRAKAPAEPTMNRDMVLLAKINVALEAMRAIHAELDVLRANLKTEKP